MALTGAVTESGAVNVLARKVLKIRALKGHPMRLIVGLFLTVLVCSALVSQPHHHAAAMVSHPGRHL